MLLIKWKCSNPNECRAFFNQIPTFLAGVNVKKNRMLFFVRWSLKSIHQIMLCWRCSSTSAIFSSIYRVKCVANAKYQNPFAVFSFLIDMREPHESWNPWALFRRKIPGIVHHFSHEIFSMRFSCLPFFLSLE